MRNQCDCHIAKMSIALGLMFVFGVAIIIITFFKKEVAYSAYEDIAKTRTEMAGLSTDGYRVYNQQLKNALADGKLTLNEYFALVSLAEQYRSEYEREQAKHDIDYKRQIIASLTED